MSEDRESKTSSEKKIDNDNNISQKEEKIKQKERTIPEEVIKSKKGILPYKLSPKNSFSKKFKDNIDSLFYEINNYSLIVNKIDTYGNVIPLGSFCFSISFILYGFYETKVNKNADDYFYLIILLLGGLGQILAGILEYIKGRTFPANLYLLYGIYFISIYYINEVNNSLLDDKIIKAFYYGSWAVLSFPIFVGSLRINVFFMVQTLVSFAFFVVKCIGEYKEINKMKGLASGILELITGFISLYICFNQIIHATLKFQALPSFPFSNENDIDIIPHPQK